MTRVSPELLMYLGLRKLAPSDFFPVGAESLVAWRIAQAAVLPACKRYRGMSGLYACNTGALLFSCHNINSSKPMWSPLQAHVEPAPPKQKNHHACA